MIVAGEPSGDAHAAALVEALKETATNIDFEFFGATGPLMRAAGVDTIINSDSLAIMGIVEVGRVLPRFIRAFRTLKAAAIHRRPDAIVLVDWPEFNLRLATSLRRQGLKSSTTSVLNYGPGVPEELTTSNATLIYYFLSFHSSRVVQSTRC
jgi:lipid-A-disaccharide synthase